MCQNYFEFIEETLKSLDNQESPDIILDCKNKIRVLEGKICELNSWLKTEDFCCELEEIHFFKCQKIKLTSRLFYYKKLLEIHINMTSSKKKKREYLVKTLEKYNQIPKGNIQFWKYFRSQSTYRDQEYFLRKNNITNSNDQYHLVFYDERITTKMEFTLALLIARDQIVEYLDKELELLEKPNEYPNHHSKSPLEWTGTKLDFVELIYALHHKKAVSAGKKDVKEIAKALGSVFNLDVEEQIYRYYIDIKRRKKDKARFVQSLIDDLNEVLDSE